jgi:hypothetical protein
MRANIDRLWNFIDEIFSIVRAFGASPTRFEFAEICSDARIAVVSNEGRAYSAVVLSQESNPNR